MTESTIGFATVMKRLIFALSLVAATAVAQTNPFLTPSPLPFQAPPFDKIKDADYRPAIEERMKRQIAEVEVIANNPDPPTFDNTIVAMERTGDVLTRATKVFLNLAQSNTNDTIQKIEAEESPKLAAHTDTIFLNPKLFARVKAIYDQRNALNLDAESKWLVERYYRNFIRAGAQLSEADKTTLKALNQEESTLSTQYRQHVLADTDASAVIVDNKADLAGLSESDMVPSTVAKATEQAARMQKLAGFKLQPWDWQYYAEQLRKKQYSMDEAQAKQYFELDRVLHDGVFYAANKLYGVTFKERHDLPVYNPDVRVFDVIDADGQPRAIWYADYYSRSNKSGGAWMDTFVDQSLLLGLKPVVFNVANFTKPAAGQPALISFTDVTTMFHEFGHALHGMFSNVKYPLLTGTSVPRDFVEFPSQFNEHWALEPEVFAQYAKNYKSGAPMPAPLVKKIKDSQKFNQGYNLGEYLEAAMLDMAWHTLPPDTGLKDVDTFEPAALERYQIA